MLVTLSNLNNMISTQIREVLELQGQYTSKNTPAMQRRGILIRKELAGALNENLERFKSKYEIAIEDLQTMAQFARPKAEIEEEQVDQMGS